MNYRVYFWIDDTDAVCVEAASPEDAAEKCKPLIEKVVRKNAPRYDTGIMSIRVTEQGS